MNHETSKCRICRKDAEAVAAFVAELREAGFQSWFTVVHEGLDVHGTFCPADHPEQKMATVIRLEWLSGMVSKSVVALLAKRAQDWSG